MAESRRHDLPVLTKDSKHILLYCPHCGHKQEETIETEPGWPLVCNECGRTTMGMAWSMTPWKKEE